MRAQQVHNFTKASVGRPHYLQRAGSSVSLRAPVNVAPGRRTTNRQGGNDLTCKHFILLIQRLITCGPERASGVTGLKDNAFKGTSSSSESNSDN